VLSALGHLADSLIRSLMVVAGYLSNSSTFPQPLSEEEEAIYLRRLREGDDEARSVLIERNLRLVAHIVNTSWAELQIGKAARRAASLTLLVFRKG
jgi:RNA polymerase sporulation-specific sigma factor